MHIANGDRAEAALNHLHDTHAIPPIVGEMPEADGDAWFELRRFVLVAGAELEELRNFRRDVLALAVPQWRSTTYTRNRLLNDLRALLGECAVCEHPDHRDDKCPATNRKDEPCPCNS